MQQWIPTRCVSAAQTAALGSQPPADLFRCWDVWRKSWTNDGLVTLRLRGMPMKPLKIFTPSHTSFLYRSYPCPSRPLPIGQHILHGLSVNTGHPHLGAGGRSACGAVGSLSTVPYGSTRAIRCRWFCWCCLSRRRVCASVLWRRHNVDVASSSTRI
jgi:hypothetical protein